MAVDCLYYTALEQIFFPADYKMKKKCKSPVLSFSMVMHNTCDILINSSAVLFTSPRITLWTTYHQHVWNIIQYFIVEETGVLQFFTKINSNIKQKIEC